MREEQESLRVTCHTRAFEPNDPRIESLLALLEGDRKIEFHVPGAFPKRIRGSRTELLNRWLADKDADIPPVLSNGSVGQDSLLVALTNQSVSQADRVGHQLLGFIDVTGGPDRDLRAHIERVFPEVAVTADAHAAQLSSPRQEWQINHRKQTLQEHLSQVTHPKEAAFYEASRDTYRYDLETKRIPMSSSSGARFSSLLAWRNYWCAATADLHKFPSPELDEVLQGLYTRVGGKGWVFSLTREHLDLGNQDHLDRMRWAFERFSPRA